ncbi:branched-chain amino acid ABC transporter permease [Bacillus sp. V2I10]|uniref:branched-chain amino acid ABC transporter permease n=1 Tax=Bacillus sp. V2I10 TaxID=3042276 RepID=UPI00278A437D|nr:branched-chain amino acid ABC transporter permease [Bacillus sp. V2I10]MDQ0860303.1 branched-chain amino acid transport system permease protein [Bacillus sp. V2I10]
MKIQRLVLLGILLITVLFPLLSQNHYHKQIIILVMIWSIAVYGLNIISGFTGQLSLAHAGFFACGAYTLGILTATYQMNFWIAFIAALAATVGLSFLIGLIALRTRHHFFAIYTMCVGFIIYLTIDKWDEVTGGVRGLIGIPVPSPIGPVTFETIESQYYFILLFLLGTILVVKRIKDSLFGRTLQAIRGSEDLSKTIGINIMKNQLLAFVLSAFFAGLAGVLYAGFIRFLGPDISAITVTFEMLMYLLVGGIGTMTGPVLGTFLIVSVTQSLQFLEEYRMLIFGPIVVLIMLFYPKGLVGSYYTLKTFLLSRKTAPVKEKVKEAG